MVSDEPADPSITNAPGSNGGLDAGESSVQDSHTRGEGSDQPIRLEGIADASIDAPARRSQAGPLPRKRGEIGYDENVHGEQRSRVSVAATALTTEVTLPSRHPADRDSSTLSTLDAVTAPDPNGSTTNVSTSSSRPRKRGLFFSLRSKLPSFGGVSTTTFFQLLFQFVFLGGTVAGWILATGHAPGQRRPRLPQGMNTTQIFIHVTFVIATLIQLICLERTIFHLRAERYAYKHQLSGGILPTTSPHRRHGSIPNGVMGLAPWNRPPLPTYAAALAANGHGTGDVEDNVIAIPPPPAYGNTRGSTLLLASLMPESLRAQRTRGRVRSGRETVRSGNGDSLRPMSAMSGASWITGRSSRPVSYKSHDSAWEERMDAERALVLEETLARLEEGSK